MRGISCTGTHARTVATEAVPFVCLLSALYTARARPAAMADAKADAKAEGDKRVKKKRPVKGDSGKDGGKKIPPTSPEAAAPKPGPVAEEGPMRYEGCGPCRRAVPDVPLSDAGRSSRDLLFLLFFVLWAIGDLVIAIIGFKTGSPQALIYGLDYAGNVCGRKNAVRAPMRALRCCRAWRSARYARATASATIGTPVARVAAAARASRLASNAVVSMQGLAPRAPLRSRRGSIPQLARGAQHAVRRHGRRTAAAGRSRCVGSQQPRPRRALAHAGACRASRRAAWTCAAIRRVIS